MPTYYIHHWLINPAMWLSASYGLTKTFLYLLYSTTVTENISEKIDSVPCPAGKVQVSHTKPIIIVWEGRAKKRATDLD